MPGVFAAGDVRADSVKRVASAVGEGAMAVSLVHRYLESSMTDTVERHDELRDAVPLRVPRRRAARAGWPSTGGSSGAPAARDIYAEGEPASASTSCSPARWR